MRMEPGHRRPAVHECAGGEPAQVAQPLSPPPATAQLVLGVCTQVLIMIISVPLLARIIEPVYGSTEFLKLILLVDVAASIGTFVLAYIIFIAAPAERKGKTL